VFTPRTGVVILSFCHTWLSTDDRSLVSVAAQNLPDRSLVSVTAQNPGKQSFVIHDRKDMNDS